MNKFVFIILGPFLLASLCTNSWAKLPQKITLTTHNLCPYGCYDSHPEKADNNESPPQFNGLIVDVIRCALTELNIPLELKVVPWTRAQMMVKEYKADGFFAASNNAERDQYATLSAAIVQHNWQWYQLKSNTIRFDSPTFKQDAMVATYSGGNTLTWVEANGYQVSARATNSAALLQLLLKNRADIILASNYVMDSLIQKANVADQIRSFTVVERPLGVYFSNKFLKLYPLFLEQFNQSISQCK